MFPRIYLVLCASLLFLIQPVAAGHAAHRAATEPTPGSAVAKAVSARVMAVPPGIRETSAFITLNNPGVRPLVLKAVRTPVAAHSMLMVTHRDPEGRTGMKEVTRLNIPARGTLPMAPSGNHLMVMGLKRALKVGEKLPFTLTFSDGRTLKVTATAYKP